MKQLRKCFLNNSLGLMFWNSELVQALWRQLEKSARSMKYGTQPMLPSEMAMRRLGYFHKASSCSQSAAPMATDIGMVAIQASIGVSIEACGAGLPAPIWIQTVMSRSASALYIGAQYSL